MVFLKAIGKKNSSEHLNTFIGDGTKLSGEFSVSGSIRIDGDFSGKISATGHLTVGKNATITASGTIHCQSAHISGNVIGDLIAPQKVHLASTSKFTGNITTQVLIVEEGAVFNGKSKMSMNEYDEQGAALQTDEQQIL